VRAEDKRWIIDNFGKREIVSGKSVLVRWLLGGNGEHALLRSAEKLLRVFRFDLHQQYGRAVVRILLNRELQVFELQ
jgi:hypothetical protein